MIFLKTLSSTFFLSIVCALLFQLTTSTPARAQVEMCGAALDNRDIGEPRATCDIYSRKFDYREKRIAFKKMVDERRKAYIAPSLESQKKYKADLKELNKSRTHEDDVTSK